MSASIKAKRQRTKKVFLVDDHPMMRQGIAQLIAEEEDLRVCGEADDSADALSRMGKLKPDLAVVDITLRSSNGLDLVKNVSSRSPSTAVLVVSMHDESIYAERALRAGARGYLLKQEGGKKLMEAIRHVLAGGTYVSNRVSAKILAGVSGRRIHNSSPVDGLSAREFEVFQLLGDGRSTKQIAEKLAISPKTVEVHRLSIKHKLNLRSATELVHFALRWANAQARS